MGIEHRGNAARYRNPDKHHGKKFDPSYPYKANDHPYREAVTLYPGGMR
jgi:hypothetical protein